MSQEKVESAVGSKEFSRDIAWLKLFCPNGDPAGCSKDGGRPAVLLGLSRDRGGLSHPGDGTRKLL